MKFLEDRFILNLKSQFLDIFVEDDGMYQFRENNRENDFYH